jgi:fatty acid desaturase 2 (delta-6 desaturase)
MKQKFVIINDYKYDITNFKHPGGNVINYMANGDNATEAFNEFHYRSKTATQVLNQLPKTKLSNFIYDDKDILKDFGKLRNSFIRKGYFKPSQFHVFKRALFIVTLYGVATYTIQYNCIAAALIFGLCGGQCGWLQHEAGHNSLTGNIGLDKLIQEFIMGFGLYVSASKWNRMHNRHHATPQKIGHDVDLETTPFVAFYKNAVSDNKATVRFCSPTWLRFQAYTFLPITSGLLVPVYWRCYLHTAHMIRNGKFREIMWTVLGTTTHIGAFMWLGEHSLGKAFLYHYLSCWLSYIYMFGHFSLSHSTTDTVGEEENPSWIRYAIEHSVDISTTNYLVGWVMGYLNYQVVHHLFPSMPQYRGYEVSKELVPFCKKYGIEYKRIGYARAWGEMLGNLNSVGKQCGNKRKRE